MSAGEKKGHQSHENFTHCTSQCHNCPGVCLKKELITIDHSNQITNFPTDFCFTCALVIEHQGIKVLID